LAALPHPILEEAATQSRGDLRRREILDAAFFVFGKLGYERATLSDVARAIGVSPGTICHHFGTKNDLFEAVIADRFLRYQMEAEALLVGEDRRLVAGSQDHGRVSLQPDRAHGVGW